MLASSGSNPTEIVSKRSFFYQIMLIYQSEVMISLGKPV